MTEIFKDIKGYEGLYQISNLGRVKSLDRMVKSKGNNMRLLKGRILEKMLNIGGYYFVRLSKNGKVRNIKIARLIAQAFIPNPESKSEVNHINGIKTDDRMKNLEWCTASENQKHAYKMGLKSQEGEKNSCSKLNEKQVRVIKHLKNIKPRMSQLAIAKVFNVCNTTISLIHSETIWKHITI